MEKVLYSVVLYAVVSLQMLPNSVRKKGEINLNILNKFCYVVSKYEALQ